MTQELNNTDKDPESESVQGKMPSDPPPKLGLLPIVGAPRRRSAGGVEEAPSL